MGGWGDILNEINQQRALGSQLTTGAIDNVRRNHLQLLHKHTDRNVIIYASGWLQKSGLQPDMVSVHPSDLDGFMEVVKACDKAKPLDLILHSPGGSGDAAEQIINYLRQKFSDIRAIVPSQAMSAATMMACGADRIVMGKHSALGPIDPQFSFRTQTGQYVMVSAHAIKADFEAAQQASKTSHFAIWAPITAQYWPGLLSDCDRATKRSKVVVGQWLKKYMFAGKKNPGRLATNAARYLADQQHNTHSRPLMRDQLRGHGLTIDDLETDQKLQELVLSVYHAATHSLGGTACTKIIECHAGKGYFKQFNPPPPAQPRP